MSTWMWAAAAAVLGAPTLVLAGVVAGRASMRSRLAAATTAAVTDPLTGVANRAGLLTELARHCAGRDPFAVLLVDLDGFKAVNDQFGHVAGDRVLIEVARRLADLVAGAGLVARLGGDEFVVVATSPVGVVSKLLGDDAARCVARPVWVTGRSGSAEVTVRASVGVVQAWPGEDPIMLLTAADEAMFRAKTRGVVEYDPGVEPGPGVARRSTPQLPNLAPFDAAGAPFDLPLCGEIRHVLAPFGTRKGTDR